MNCLNHPDREARLTIDLPSLGIQTYYCEECRKALDERLAKAPPAPRESWDHWGYDYRMYGGRVQFRSTSGWRYSSNEDK